MFEQAQIGGDCRLSVFKWAMLLNEMNGVPIGQSAVLLGRLK
jgi:hypothetical protein